MFNDVKRIVEILIRQNYESNDFTGELVSERTLKIGLDLTRVIALKFGVYPFRNSRVRAKT